MSNVIVEGTCGGDEEAGMCDGGGDHGEVKGRWWRWYICW